MFESSSDLIALTVGFCVVWLIWEALTKAEARRERRALRRVRVSGRAAVPSRSRPRRAA